LNSNWMKDLRTEVFRRMYEDPIHPANLWLNRDPGRHAEVDEVYRDNIRRLVERGSYTPPASSFPGARYIAAGDEPESDDWNAVRKLWAETDPSGAGSTGAV